MQGIIQSFALGELNRNTMICGLLLDLGMR